MSSEQHLGHKNILPSDEAPKPLWIPLRRNDLFPEGSIGYQGFLPELEGRLRPEHILTERMQRTFRPALGDRDKERLKQNGVETIGDMLSLSEEAYRSIVQATSKFYPSIEHALYRLNSVITLPQTRLLWQIFPIEFPNFERLADYYILPADVEPEFRIAIDTVLETLRSEERAMLSDVYGFSTWKQMTHEEVGQKNGISRERVRKLTNIIYRKLRAEARKKPLSKYPPLIESRYRQAIPSLH